jgi:LuxR family maltose regulon positive regulatory protein
MLIRGDPPFSLSRLRARNEVLDLHASQLKFSLEETRTFLERELPFSLSPQLLRLIFERMDGWPVGLRLLSKEVGWADSVQEIEHRVEALTGSYWSIREYFLTEVLHTLPAEQQEFLLQTSILPRVTASLCDVVMDRADSTQLIEVLRAGDLFLISLDGMGEWARYYPLFAETMQQEAHKRLGNERLCQLADRASTWYEEHGFLAEAIDTALSAAAFTRAASLIQQFLERKQPNNISTIPELYSVKRWLEHLPDKELERNPDLCLHYAMTQLFILMDGQPLPGSKELIPHLLQMAEQRWRDTNNTAKLAEVFAFRAFLANREARMLQAVTWARQALVWLPQEERIWRTFSLTVVGRGEILDGNLDNALRFFLEARTLSEQLGIPTYVRATRGMVSGAILEQGELHRAAEQCRQMQAEARTQGDFNDIAHMQLALARIAYQWNNLEDAEQAACEALEIGEQIKDEEFQARATALLALIEHARDQTMQAQQRLAAWLARSPMPTSPRSVQLSRQVQATLAYVQLTSGDQAAVERWFASVEGNEEILHLLQQRYEQLLRARLLLAQEAISSAIERLESLYTAALQTGHVYIRLEVQIVLALAYSRQGSYSKARELLRDLLVATRSEGYLRIFLNEGKELADLLRGLLPSLHEKVLLVYVRHILNAFALKISPPSLEIAPDAPLLLAPLSQQEQKVLRLLASGNSNAEIARELVVSINTVRTQVQSIYRKLNVNNRVEASAIANQLKLV